MQNYYKYCNCTSAYTYACVCPNFHMHMVLFLTISIAKYSISTYIEVNIKLYAGAMAGCFTIEKSNASANNVSRLATKSNFRYGAAARRTRRATRPFNCNKESTPSATRICVKPISWDSKHKKPNDKKM